MRTNMSQSPLGNGIVPNLDLHASRRNFARSEPDKVRTSH